GVGAVAWYELFWFNSAGSPVGGSGLQNLFADLTEDYQEFGDVFTAPAGADSVEVSIRLEGGAFEGSSGELYIDDVVLDGASMVDPGGGGELDFQIARNGANLVFSWNGRVGRAYDLRSSDTLDRDPRSWPIVFGDISATAGRNVELVALLEGADEFFVLVERAP
ncbi:MAG: hypothetical protein P8J87_08995, partial [Verrucomicrobiales bacterium]|nr:hypothetical protein [Verrucomicrobiales bacterium]